MAQVLDSMMPGAVQQLRISVSLPGVLCGQQNHRLAILLALSAGFIDEHYEFPGQMWAYLSDGIGIMTGSMMGTSPLTVFLESAAGIEDGGRTGVTGVCRAACTNAGRSLTLLLAVPLTPQLGLPSCSHRGGLLFFCLPLLQPRLCKHPPLCDWACARACW